MVFISASALSGLYLLRQVHGPVAEVWVTLGHVGFQSFRCGELYVVHRLCGLSEQAARVEVYFRNADDLQR